MHITYGMSSQADIRAKDIEREKLGVGFEIIYQDRSLGRVVVGMPGKHNVLNALGAISVGLELDMGIEDIKKGLRNLGSLERRFQVKGQRNDILVLDD